MTLYEPPVNLLLVVKFLLFDFLQDLSLLLKQPLQSCFVFNVQIYCDIEHEAYNFNYRSTEEYLLMCTNIEQGLQFVLEIDRKNAPFLFNIIENKQKQSLITQEKVLRTLNMR